MNSGAVVYPQVEERLRDAPKRWLVTGGGGFIGSHLTDRLLELGQEVVVLDNFSTGKRENLAQAAAQDGARLKVIEGDITLEDDVNRAMEGVCGVFHLAARGSVPRSIKDPVGSSSANIMGFVQVLSAFERRAGESRGRVVYSSSSSVYGDSPELPKCEERIGQVLSPYAATKRCNEVYAEAYESSYGISTVGLRYFNVFGPRQDPEGAYAAVIPRWVYALLKGEECVVYGDGSTSRDFCYVENVVQANLISAMSEFDSGSGLKRHSATRGRVYNVACGERTTLVQLFDAIALEVGELVPGYQTPQLRHEPPRAGDIQHSLASLERVRRELGYEPAVYFREGIKRTVQWCSEVVQ